MDINTYTAVTRYLVVTDFGSYGTEGITVESFSDACDKYAETMDDRSDSRVYAVVFGAGTVADVTGDAAQAVAQRCNDRRIDLPVWLIAALGDVERVAA